MQESYAKLVPDIVGIYGAGNRRIYRISGNADPDILGKPGSNRNWKACIPNHRCKLCTCGIFSDNAGIFSGNRRRRYKPVSVITTTNCMPGADLLAILISGTELHMVFLPGIGSDLQWNRTNPVCKDN